MNAQRQRLFNMFLFKRFVRCWNIAYLCRAKTIKEYNNEEGSYLEYVATRKDSKLGVIMGKTCKVRIENPKCLDQCNGCDAKGTDDNHRCFDCKPGFWYDKKDTDKTGC